ncbi:hypothetical protein [Sphingomonas hengshuiensis]|uniref:hypothetical protein n=1 Tax=Sphingomonas hengshuiensis TaxID=1609977 RepID=UPI0012B71B24|nr:hypothetical protein [Sphingomonas hengshuiensis]
MARELIALSERYSDREFDRASELLMSGELFANAMGAARTARILAGKGAAQKAGPRRLPPPPASNQPPKARNASEPLPHLEIDDLLGDLEGEEREALSSFAMRFQSREILESGSSARMFAQQMGVQLSKSIPARQTLLRTLLRHLLDVPRDSRANLLREADRSGNGESSLQRWSDLIVKPD